jgi:hypothetical protein
MEHSGVKKLNYEKGLMRSFAALRMTKAGRKR